MDSLEFLTPGVKMWSWACMMVAGLFCQVVQVVPLQLKESVGKNLALPVLCRLLAWKKSKRTNCPSNSQ